MPPKNDDRTFSRARLKQVQQAIRGLQESTQGFPHGKVLEFAAAVGNSAELVVDFTTVPVLQFPIFVLRSRTFGASNPRLNGLSPRESQVASLIAQGLTNKEIALRLDISILTVKDHVHRILSKTALPNRAAVAAAHR